MLTMKAIRPGDAPLKQIKAVQTEWKKALREQGKQNKRQYEKTTDTWSHHVTFNIRTNFSADNWYVDTFARNRIYWFVHESVSVMRGVLSPDWSPKTQPRVLGSGAGSGRLLYASKQISLPPYPARKFTETIIKEEEPAFEKRMYEASLRGVRKGP